VYRERARCPARPYGDRIEFRAVRARVIKPDLFARDRKTSFNVATPGGRSPKRRVFFYTPDVARRARKVIIFEVGDGSPVVVHQLPTVRVYDPINSVRTKPWESPTRTSRVKSTLT